MTEVNLTNIQNERSDHENEQDVHPREKPSRRNLWSISRSKQLEPSQENGRIFKRSIEGEKKTNSLAIDEILGKIEKRAISVWWVPYPKYG